MPESETDGRTPGWPEGWMGDCWRWSAEQHAQVAADLLDGTFVPTASEDGWDGRPAYRHYVIEDEGDTGYAPLLAALAHIGLAMFKRDADLTSRPGKPGAPA